MDFTYHYLNDRKIRHLINRRDYISSYFCVCVQNMRNPLCRLHRRVDGGERERGEKERGRGGKEKKRTQNKNSKGEEIDTKRVGEIERERDVRRIEEIE